MGGGVGGEGADSDDATAAGASPALQVIVLYHISGFVINTAGLPGSRPKRLAGLPSTIAAFKKHIFNNVIWPNLSDENNGAGLVTYMRLVEGGSPALGEGEGKGYLEISDGLAVKVWGVSHGHCIERHSHRGSVSSARHASFDGSSMSIGPIGVGMGASMPLLSPRTIAHHNSANSANPSLSTFLQQQQQQQRDQERMQNSQATASTTGLASSVSGGHSTGESVCVYDSSAYFIRDVVTGREVLIFGDVEPDSVSLSPRNHQIWREAGPKIAAGKLAAIFIECSYDDSQSVDRLYGHLTPRFIAEEMKALAHEVNEARLALFHDHNVAGGPGSNSVDRSHSEYASGSDKKKKRKRESIDETASLLTRRKTTTSSQATRSSASGAVDEQGAVPLSNGTSEEQHRSNGITQNHNSTSTRSLTGEDPVSPKTVVKPFRRVESSTLSDEQGTTESPHISTPTAELTLRDIEMMSGPVTPLSSAATAHTPPAVPYHLRLPLKGLRVVVIHVKDKLNDGPYTGDVILEELRAHEAEAQFGCEYIVSSVGQSLYL